MNFKIGQNVIAIDMFMMTSYNVIIHNIIYYKKQLHLILKKDSRYSLGQLYFNKIGDEAISEVRATSWHDSLESLTEYWTDKQVFS